MASLDADLADTPYRAVTRIGQGGMGAVFEVVHVKLGRPLVLKILRQAERRDLEDRLRFEAQTLGQLTHPNLLAVLDFGFTRSGRPFLVTELLRGRTLKALVAERGALSAREAARCVIQALSGLAAAHRAGVVHRDIKTDNLFVCEDHGDAWGFIKVIDFGVAKLMDGALDLRSSIEPLEIPTGDGMMVGTPSFMSPEQICAKKVDRRSDIFSMGMVLYRLLAGRGPFEHGDLLATVRANVRDPAPPPSVFAPNPISAELDALVLRAIAKRRRDRFQSAEEMADALAPFAEGTEARLVRRSMTIGLAGTRRSNTAPATEPSRLLGSSDVVEPPFSWALLPAAPSARKRKTRATWLGWIAFGLTFLAVGGSTLLLLAWLGWT